jgi:hypothetical protein
MEFLKVLIQKVRDMELVLSPRLRLNSIEVASPVGSFEYNNRL